jgi:tetratricopeptide (TPR) repeat protein
MQAFRDGAIGSETSALEHAIVADPTLAPAHLRLAILLLRRDSREGRERYQSARQLRSTLDARDQDFLEAAAPYVTRTPSDAAEWRRRLAVLAQRYPGDAEILYYLASAHGLAGELPDARDAARRALETDPQFNASSVLYGEALAYLGDMEGAARVLRACVERTPSATTCAIELEKVYQQRGDCDAMGELAHRVLDATPGAPFASYCLAESLAARGAAPAAVRAALEQEVVTVDATHRERVRLQRAFEAAASEGDFGAAERAARDLRELVANDQPIRWHAVASDELVSLYTETGRTADAGTMAREYLAAADAWTPEVRIEDQALELDAEPRMLAAERRSGLLAKEVFAGLRDKWVGQRRADVAPFYWGYVWVHGYAATTDTADDAREALAALANFGGMPAYLPNAHMVAVGWVYFLAGNLQQAVPLLESAARSCTTLRDPITHVRAHYQLGRAREAQGDDAGACSEYRTVLDRWGRAQLGSVTLRDAGARARALKCDL